MAIISHCQEPKKRWYDNEEMITAPDNAAKLPKKEMPPLVPAGTGLIVDREIQLLFSKGPISLAQVSAVTAATKAIKKNINISS